MYCKGSIRVFSSEDTHKKNDGCLFGRVQLLVLCLMLVPAKTNDNFWKVFELAMECLAWTVTSRVNTCYLEISSQSLYTHIGEPFTSIQNHVVSLTWFCLLYGLVWCTATRITTPSTTIIKQTKSLTSAAIECGWCSAARAHAFSDHLCMGPLKWPTTHTNALVDQHFCMFSPSTSVSTYSSDLDFAIFIWLICIRLPLYVCQLK